MPEQVTQWLGSLRQRVLVLSYYIGASGIYVFSQQRRRFTSTSLEAALKKCGS